MSDDGDPQPLCSGMLHVSDRLTTPLATMRIGICLTSLSSGSRPRDGFNPTSPLQDAGIRIEPPPSLAWAIGSTTAATNAPETDADAPAGGAVFHGLRPGPRRGCSAEALKPYSDIWVLPNGVIPVARYVRANSLSALVSR